MDGRGKGPAFGVRRSAFENTASLPVWA